MLGALRRLPPERHSWPAGEGAGAVRITHASPISSYQSLLSTLTWVKSGDMRQRSAETSSACVLHELMHGNCPLVYDSLEKDRMLHMGGLHCRHRFLHDLLPEDVHERCSDRTFVRSRLHRNP